jgi:DNA-directed RNA polymerase subunit alpha
MSETTAELSTYFDGTELTRETAESYAERAHESFAAWERFEALVREHRQAAEAGGGDALKIGVGLVILGRYADALEWLGKAKGGALKHLYAAQAATALGRYSDALAALKQAAGAGCDALEVDVRSAVLLLRAGDVAGARALVEKHARGGADRADWYYAAGELAEADDERARALEQYQRALTLNPGHEQAAFRAAWLHDLRGEDEEALRLYEQLARKPRARVNALMNMAVICEDTGRYDEALRCLRRVLRVNPQHPRARLFLKDVESSRQMVIDEAADSRADARSRLLDAPISEFELSVRARNCLKKMNINTIGQLIQLTEAELLAYKNFGEASLSEIKQLLARKGLRLGQRPDEIDPSTIVADEATARAPVPPGREALLSRSVAELELSVRSRRCLQRLNVQTLGDLMQHSEAELLATRNFGVTSLNEIKARLAELGLELNARRAE